MRNVFNSLRGFVLLFLLLALPSYVNAKEWELSPEKPAEGLVSPRHDPESKGAALLGRNKDKKKDGDPESLVRKKFKCGKEQDKWCTIHLVISFYRADKERLKITLIGEGDQKHVVFLKKETTADPNTSNSQRFAISVKGCKQCEVTVQITEGDKKNIQSWASVTVSNSPGPTCTDADQTGGEGTVSLVNEEGEDITPPTPTPTPHE